MYCNKHLDLHAYQLCGYCFKGLCQDCCSEDSPEVRGRAVCSDRCNRELSELVAIEEKSKIMCGVGANKGKTTYPSAPLQGITAGLFISALGLGFTFSSPEGKWSNLIFVFFGILTITFSIRQYIKYKRIGLNI